jgi:uncharacterized membrane protein
VTAVSTVPAVPTTSPVNARRIESIDLVRGIVMVVMVLDHTRDFVHNAALQFDPTDLSRTTPVLFFTRWVTHYCAPAFVFMAGTAAYLQTARGVGRTDLSKFLFTRGLWLVLLEFTAVRWGAWFNVDYTFLAAVQVIWVLGVSMVVLAALVHLPPRFIAAIGVAMILFHNVFDGIRVAGWQGAGTPAPALTAKLWILLHQPQQFLPVASGSGPFVWVMYPLIPWIGVMAAGYSFGSVYGLDHRRRQRLLLWTGATLTMGFVIVRATNLYGDPQPWTPQATPLLTLLSFINTTKYPPSLLFLMMTLGPMLLALAWLDDRRFPGSAGRTLLMFGRVPLFFYLLQWPLAHGMALVLTWLAGKNTGYLFRNPPEFFTTAPADAGFPLWVVYACWATVVTVLFFLCRWFAQVKRTNPSTLLRYL